MGSVTTRCLGTGAMEAGSGGGGEGGGECWYVVALLYVVHEKRLVGACLSFSGVCSVDVLSTELYGGVALRCIGETIDCVDSYDVAAGEGVCCVGVVGLG